MKHIKIHKKHQETNCIIRWLIKLGGESSLTNIRVNGKNENDPHREAEEENRSISEVKSKVALRNTMRLEKGQNLSYRHTSMT